MQITQQLFSQNKLTNVSDTCYATKEELLLLFLLGTDCVSVIELKLMGFMNPSATIHRLRQKNIPIKGYYQQAEIIDGNIVYGHIRYFLSITDLLEVTNAA